MMKHGKLVLVVDSRRATNKEHTVGGGRETVSALGGVAAFVVHRAEVGAGRLPECRPPQG